MNDETGGDSPTLAQLRSWLGPELAVGVLDVPADGSDPTVLGFAEVRDRAQLEAALKKDKRHEGARHERRLTTSSAAAATADDRDLRRHGPALELASSASRPRSRASAARGDSLADLAAFQDTMSKLATDNIVVGYAPGSTLPKLRRDAAARAPGASRRRRSAAARRPKLAAVRSLGFSLRRHRQRACASAGRRS